MALFAVFVGAVIIASSFVLYRDPEEKDISEGDKAFRTALSKILSAVAVVGYVVILVVAPAICRWGW